MGLREWVGRLDETDRKGMTAWGFIAGLVMVGMLVPAIGWAIALVIAGAWFIFLWGLVLYAWLGWMVPERKSHMEPEMTRPRLTEPSITGSATSGPPL